MSFRNRCRIAGAEGTIDLSIPLEKGRDQRTLTRDVRIAATGKWRAEHWKTICSCYRRSPWFEFYEDGLERLYRQQAVFLMDWDLACFEWVIGTLGLGVEISFSDAWQKDLSGSQWVDWRDRLRPQTIGQQEGSPVYRQVFEERTGFKPGLSILDLLFCEGKNALGLLV